VLHTNDTHCQIDPIWKMIRLSAGKAAWLAEPLWQACTQEIQHAFESTAGDVLQGTPTSTFTKAK